MHPVVQMQKWMRVPFLLLLLISSAFANESIHIDCLNLLVEKDTDESLGHSKIAKFISRENDARFFSTLHSTEPTLGANAFSEAERETMGQAKSEIRELIEKQNSEISNKIKTIKQNNKGMHIDDAKKRAREELQNDAAFVRNELQIQRKKAEIAIRYGKKLQALNVDLFAAPEQLAASLKQIDPFESAKLPRLRFAFKRGEKVQMNPLEESYREKKFLLHAHEFEPPLTSSKEYEQRIRRLAESEDPKIISFSAIGNLKDPRIRIHKYDPATNELLVVGRDTQDFISFYRIKRRSAGNARGYRESRMTPLQYFINSYYLRNGVTF